MAEPPLTLEAEEVQAGSDCHFPVTEEGLQASSGKVNQTRWTLKSHPAQPSVNLWPEGSQTRG